MATKSQIIAMSAPVSITAGEVEGDRKGPAKFNVLAYTGGILPGALKNGGEREDVILDLSGMKTGKSLIANLDHEIPQRVGHINAIGNDGKQLTLAGIASAATHARDEVVNSAADGFAWQASIEANPTRVSQVKPGSTIEVNGQSFTAPPKGGRDLYVAHASVLKGFAFVSHGADDNTTVAIAASAASTKEKNMKAEVKTWIKAMVPSIDLDSLTDEDVERIEAQYAGINPEKPKKKLKLDEGIEAKQAETDRIDGITEIALNACDKRPYDIKAIKELAQSAIDGKWTVEKFRLELLEASLPPAHTVFRTRKDDRMSNRVMEAAICQSGRLPNIDKEFDDQTLQAAHDRFKGRLGLKQLFLLCAQANGYNESSMDVTLDVQRAAFGMVGNRSIHAASAFSTLDIATIVSNTANKFIMRGWNMVDRTALNIAKVQNVRDFKTATTVSLTDSVLYEKVGAAGEIKHGTLGELSYTVKADTYAKMLAITRQDIINDDTGALTDVPMKLGNGAIKKLNDIFWTEFLGLVGGGFFASGNNNINTGVADMTEGGLDATYVIFKNQTNPDGTPLGVEPKILLVPTALEGKALRLMRSENFNNGATNNQGSTNIWANRFTVYSSPYISNSSYTGNTSTAWWMLADPNELPVIAIAALNGRVEPTVETADADFNVLGVQMRGYSDVGVNEQEFRGGVHADGGSS